MERFIDYDYLKTRIGKAKANAARRLNEKIRKHDLAAILGCMPGVITSKDDDLCFMVAAKRLADYSGKIAKSTLFVKTTDDRKSRG